MTKRWISIKAGVLLTVMALLSGFGIAQNVTKGKRVGIIGLDTSHSIAFTKAMNSPTAGDSFLGYKVVAAYPQGSLDIQSSVERIEGYTKEIQNYDVEIVASIEELLTKVDVVLLETNDGRRHLEQALPVLKAGKRLFIDKPMAASLSDAMAIFDAAEHYNVPVFSASSLRYIVKMDEVTSGKAGKVLGAETFSPCKLEPTHPDFFWYGIHGVEPLFTAMGTGCKTVVRVTTADTDMAIGTWADGRIGSFRGLRGGKAGYGGIVFGEKDIITLGSYNGYNPLLEEIVRFFESGVLPFPKEETLEILAFMEAADWSKKKGGIPVSMEDVMKKAEKESKKKIKL
ncbi:Gfo/Idh/MocA family oxidoreductase [Maribellus sp. CM-23]|uniref:Gfo/Idh/MocA family protein n=1 Tax=Maribellus sp. CM-23 TaxID=2781026 RepID=UPI001F176B56|nr:Gfo/Idh/MocA family oxidoreductase [Maribellus sp. CM-23]MCE4563453.1 Gfo/Idh/MocA family oxidoreductase [Maribellus sp. CM-23]